MLPQIIYLAIIFIEMIFVIIHHGEKRKNYDFGEYLISSLLAIAILYWGGFFDCFFKK
jgi:hypothetical protein